MAGGVGQKLFEKKLTSTDMGFRLHWPARFLSELPSFNDGRHVDFTAKDGDGKLWKFRCSKRTTGYGKEVVSGEWLQYLGSKGDLKDGAQVIFYRSQDPSANFEVRLKKKVKIFGVDINDNTEI